jgi:hypothetical protein
LANNYLWYTGHTKVSILRNAATISAVIFPKLHHKG